MSISHQINPSSTAQLHSCPMQAHPGKVCLVVLHESVTRGFSASNNKGTQISNCLFRLNGAALILTNRYGRVSSNKTRAGITLTLLPVWGLQIVTECVVVHAGHRMRGVQSMSCCTLRGRCSPQTKPSTVSRYGGTPCPCMRTPRYGKAHWNDIVQSAAAMQVREDEKGIMGVFLQKRELIAAAGACIRSTLKKLAPRILPLPELVRVRAYLPYFLA